VQFKRAPLMLFKDTPVTSLSHNALILRIQPNEGISLCFNAKVPGPFERLETVTMDFSYSEYFKTEATTGYETLLFDAMNGDQTLFHRMYMVEAGWQVVASILAGWQKDTRSKIPIYQQGSWGPAEADLLIEHDGREWRD
jgi:glucose-6-phosphate 1-dehydrogenase